MQGARRISIVSSRAWVLVLVAPILVQEGCIPEVDPNAVTTTDTGFPDWTTYAGLHIYAHKWVTGPNGEAYLGYGPVNLVLFENDVVSECYDQITGDLANEYGHVCDGINIDKPLNNTPDAYCGYAVCAQQLALCAGYKNLSLADAVDAVEFSAYSLTIDKGYPEYTPPGGTYERGRVEVRHIFNPESPSGAGMVVDSFPVRYKVPPQAPGDRTLLYEAATEYFRAAGIVSGEAIEGGCLEPAAVRTAWSGGPEAGISAAGGGASNPVPTRELALAGFQEAVLRFNDAIQRLVRNEQEVSSSISGALDTADRQNAFWNGEVNSRMSALRRVVGDPSSTGPEAPGLPVALMPLDDAVKAAMDLLRASGVELIDRHPMPTGDKLAWEALRLLHDDREASLDASAATADADAGDAGCPSDGGEEARLPGTRIFTEGDVERYMVDRGLTAYDFSAAAEALREEAAILVRPPVEATTTASGIPRSFAFSSTPRNPAPVVRRLEHSAAFVRDLPESTLDEHFALQGAVQAFQYFRDAARMPGPDVVTEEERRLLDRIVVQADAIAGATTVRFTYGACAAGECMVNVQVLDPPFSDEPGRLEFAALVRGLDGLECATTGSLGGKRCGPLAGSAMLDRDAPEDGAWPAILTPGGERPGFGLSPADAVEVGTQLFVLVGNGIDLPQVVGSSIVREPPGGLPSITEEASEGGAADAVLTAITSVRPEYVPMALLQCGSLPADFVPPLENELTAMSTEYESSWRHYLDTAEQLAAETDALGQQMLDRGLRMDQMAEEAEAQLRSICGDVGPVPEDNPEGTAAHDCYEDETQTVSLGGPVCLYIVDGFQCVCPSEADYGKPSPEWTICDAPCAMPAPADLAGMSGEEQADECERLFREWRASPTTPRVDPPDAEDPVEFVYVSNGLDLFPAADDAPATAVDCAVVYDFRCLVEGTRGRQLGCLTSKYGLYEDERRHSSFAAMQTRVEEAWSAILSQGWASLSNLRKIADSLRLEASQFHNYTAYSGSRVLWSTATPEAGLPCRDPHFFRFFSRLSPEAPAGGDPRYCFQQAVTSAEVEAWWCDQYGGAELGDMLAARRVQDANSVLMAMDGALLLGGMEGALAIGHDDPNTASGHGPSVLAGAAGSYPWPLTGLNLFAYTGDLCTSGACSCVPVTVPEGLGCAPQGMRNAFETSEFTSTGGAIGFCDPSRGVYRYLDAEWSSAPLPAAAQAAYIEMMTQLPRLLVPPDEGVPPLPRAGVPEWLDGLGWGNDGVGRVLDGLELACYIAEEGVSCSDFNPNVLPVVRSPDDLVGVRRYLECAAETIAQGARSIVLQEVPRELVVAIQRDGLETYFPGVQGAKLEAFLRIEAAMGSFQSQADELSSILFQIGERLELYKHEVNRAEIEGEIRQIQSMIASIQTAAAAAAAVISAASGGGYGGLAQAAVAPVILVLEGQIRDLQAEAVEEGVATLTSQLMMDVGTSLDRLRQVSEGVGQSLRDVQSGLGSLKLLRQQAELAAARAGFELSNSAERTYRINEAMRNWLATDRARYETLLGQAKDMAFVARRAIEFRLGVNMHEMHGGMRLVPAPADWYNQICSMRGMDYDHLSGRDRIRGPGDDDVVPDAVGTAEWDSWNGDFVGGYVGDYVRMLRLFVESYPMNFPFTDGTDTVVLSLKDDLLEGVYAACERESYNHIYSTEDLGTPWAWNAASCALTDPADPDSALCVGPTGVPPETVEDADLPFSRARRLQVPDGFPMASDDVRPAVAQTVVGLHPGGRYALSWWAADGEPVCGPGGPTYRVKVLSASGETAGDLLYGASVERNPTADWGRIGISLETPDDCDSVTVVLEPSTISVSGLLESGSLLVGGWQLEEHWGGESLSPEAVASRVRPYEAVADSRRLTEATCPDRDGGVLRTTVGHMCECSSGAVCRPGEAVTGECKYVKDFVITLGGIEAGAAMSNAPISPRNFNYRIEAIGLNVVGTNVRRCAEETSGEGCYGSAYLPYTLVHQGADMAVRNWTDQEEDFDLPTARIEHAKALAAEVVLTNPMTGSQEALMTSYIKDELRGRPLNGNYTLYIWDTPELDWSRVEDIQLVVRYRYWTRME